MNPYSVKLYWNEPDGSPNMMIMSVEAQTIADAISFAVRRLHTAHFIVDPIKIEAELDVVRASLAQKSGSSSSTAGSEPQA